MGTNQKITRALSDIAMNQGADLFGISDLRPVREFVINQGGPFFERFTHAVAIGIKLSSTVVNQLDPLLPADYSLYGFHVYEAVSPLLDTIAQLISRELERNGFHAVPVPTSQFRKPGERISLFSHKLAAHMAGLGWIGKNCLLITPEFGPKIRLVTVLTDAELAAGNPMEGRCGDCTDCVDVCPVGAIKGTEFIDTEGVETRIDVNACGNYRDGENAGARRGAHVCALCLAKCPKGNQGGFQ